MSSDHKVVRSYRLVFRRNWRIFRIQGWRIPLPGGIELRLLGYWLACLAAGLLIARLPLLGLFFLAFPPSLRLVALPLAAAWLLSRTELDGRPPHRALLGMVAWRMRPSSLAGLRRVPPPASELSPLFEVACAPDLGSSHLPRGVISGPARLLLRYPARAERRGRRLRLRLAAAAPLHDGRTVEVPAGQSVSFEPEAR